MLRKMIVVIPYKRHNHLPILFEYIFIMKAANDISTATDYRIYEWRTYRTVSITLQIRFALLYHSLNQLVFYVNKLIS